MLRRSACSPGLAVPPGKGRGDRGGTPTGKMYSREWHDGNHAAPCSYVLALKRALPSGANQPRYPLVVFAAGDIALIGCAHINLPCLKGGVYTHQLSVLQDGGRAQLHGLAIHQGGGAACGQDAACVSSSQV